MARPLTIVYTPGEHVPVLDREHPLGAHEFDRVTVEPIIGAYRRMVRGLEFDVAEMAPGTYLIARAHGLPVTALPIFTMRKSHYADVVVRRASGIRTVDDMRGHRFGIRAFTVTTALWVREFLRRRYRIDVRDVQWVVDDDEHVADVALPRNVSRLAAGGAVADEFAAGRVDLALRGRAGVGRKGNPLTGWTTVGGDADADGVRRLIDDADALGRADLADEGIYPLHRVLVVKDAVLAQRPDLAHALFRAFAEAKRDWLAARPAPAPDGATGGGIQDSLADPWPYGVQPNRRTLAALLGECTHEGLVPAGMTVAESFVDVES